MVFLNFLFFSPPKNPFYKTNKLYSNSKMSSVARESHPLVPLCDALHITIIRGGSPMANAQVDIFFKTIFEI